MQLLAHLFNGMFDANSITAPSTLSAAKHPHETRHCPASSSGPNRTQLMRTVQAPPLPPRRPGGGAQFSSPVRDSAVVPAPRSADGAALVQLAFRGDGSLSPPPVDARTPPRHAPDPSVGGGSAGSGAAIQRVFGSGMHSSPVSVGSASGGPAGWSGRAVVTPVAATAGWPAAAAAPSGAVDRFTVVRPSAAGNAAPVYVVGRGVA
jgi:hypothetical protein